MIINFRFQLNAQYFISIVMFLYIFRAHLYPSSGGPLYIYNEQSLTNLPTVRSPKETDIEPDVVNIQGSS